MAKECDCVAKLKQSAFDYWAQTLLDFGFSGELRRIRGLCRFFTLNDFRYRQHLCGAPHPREWSGAGQLSVDELELIWAVCQTKVECRGHAGPVWRACI